MMALMWYLLGAYTVAAFIGYKKIKGSYKINIIGTLGFLISAITMWFCIAWSWASFAEREPQSGAMGLIMFGLGSILFFVVTWRTQIEPNKITE